MTEAPHVHALLYTATCGEILEPILKRLVADGRVRVSATTLLPTAILGYSALSRVEGIELFNEPRELEGFVSSPGRKLLLLVADWTHVAHTIGREAVHAARSVGIPSLSVQHGVFFLKDGRLVSWDFTADRMCVWGDWFRDRLLEAGKEPSRVVLTGNPRLPAALDRGRDTSVTRPRCRSAVVALATHAQLSYPELASRWNQDRIVAMVEAVFSGLAAAGIERIIVRPHPAEVFWNRVNTYVEASESAGVSVEYSNYYDEHDDLFGLLSDADVVVTQGSTVGLYAIRCGTPVIALALDSDKTLTPCDPYPDGKLYRQLDPDPETLVERLAESVASVPLKVEVESAKQDFLASYFAPGDGAAAVVATIVDSLGL